MLLSLILYTTHIVVTRSQFMTVCVHCLSVCLYVCLSVCLHVCMHGCMHVCISILLYVCPSVHPSISLSIYIHQIIALCSCACLNEEGLTILKRYLIGWAQDTENDNRGDPKDAKVNARSNKKFQRLNNHENIE